MKTLDEVIKAFEVCRSEATCKDCPSAVMLSPDDYRCSEEHIDGALEHLKEYREILDNVENEPLEFVEVRAMFGQPVWVEVGSTKKWCLVNWFDSAITNYKGVALTDRYGVDFVCSEDDFENGIVKVYKKENKMSFGIGGFVNIKKSEVTEKSLSELIHELSRREVLNDRNDFIITAGEVADTLHYLDKLQAISEEPPFGEEPLKSEDDGLGLFELAIRIGKPVFVVFPEHDEVAMCGMEPRKKKDPEKRCWEIVKGVKRTDSNDYVLFKGSCEWIPIDYIKVYPTEEGAKNE